MLCGPPSLVPDAFADFLEAPPPGQAVDPVLQRGRLQISRNLDECLSGADAVMTLRLQQERMTDHLLTDLDRYHRDYGLTHERLRRCSFSGPVLHPGPVNRGVEMSGALLDDRSICLVEDQVRNGIPIRMALLYLMAASDPVADSSRAASPS